MAEKNQILIKIDNIYKSFKLGTQNISVLRGVSLEIKEGDFAIIFGPSGCGKSTLLYTILGLEVPSSGSIHYWDVDLYNNTDEDFRTEFRSRHVGMVYQQSNWVGALNVLENVAVPLTLLGMDRIRSLEIAEKMLTKVGMQNWAKYSPSELSSGQQQKVAVARALVTNPEIIIADEPTGNLDYESGRDLIHLLGDLRFGGKTIIMVTHDLEYLQYATTAIQMKDGVITQVSCDEEKCEVFRNAQFKKKIDSDKKAPGRYRKAE